MAVVDLVTGRREQLTFSEDRYKIAGWVPESAAASKLIGLFPLSDGSFRLADKLGVNAAFDPAGALTDLALSSAYQLHYEQANRLLAEDFVEPPYELEREGSEMRQFGSVSLPATIRLSGPTDDERLDLRTDAPVVGYYPRETSSSVKFVAILTNGDLRLVDRSGNEFAFDAGGRFLAMLLERPVVKSLAQDKQSIAFRFMLGANGVPRITEAASSADPSKPVKYEYGAGGRELVAAVAR
jgi:hypothetical protein